MVHSFLSWINYRVPFTRVSAHCDRSCNIYDPSAAQMAALTVIRMIDLIEEFSRSQPQVLIQKARLERLVAEKERQALRVKAEIQLIWGDCLKAALLDKEPRVNDLVRNIMLQASRVKQCHDKDEAVKLLKLVDDFAELFWSTKDIESAIGPCSYLPDMFFAHPKLA